MFTLSAQERRRLPRVSHQTEVYFKPGWKGNQRGFIRDLSESGSFLVALERMYEGVEVLLYVTLSMKGKESLCVIPGKVVRVEKKDGVEAFGYGIHFGKLSPGTVTTLKRFIEAQLKEEFGIQTRAPSHAVSA
jgi:c-di-GMP-binding flagellar brake protein YcgR